MEENKETEQTVTEEIVQDNYEEEETSSVRKRIVTVLTSGMLVISVLLCLMVVTQVLSKRYVSIGGYSLFRVVTGSMEPEIPVGSLLISKKVDIEEIEVGDIVTFRSKESSMIGVIITHRVIEIHEGPTGEILLETRGDANQYADGYFADQSNLIGRAVYYTKEANLLAGIFSVLTSKTGFLACIVVPCLLIGVFAMRDCVRNLKEEIDAVSKQLDEEDSSGEKKTLEQQLSVEEYRELCERLKVELLEELKQSVEENQSEQKEQQNGPEGR